MTTAVDIIESVDVTGKHKLVYYENPRHKYELDGKPVVGVTTANKRGYPESEALIRWRIKNGMKEYETGAKAKAAASIGSMLHDYAYHKTIGDQANLNLLMTMIGAHEDKEKILNTIDLFDQWYRPMEVVQTESICASVKYKFAGKIDLLVKEGNDLILLDYKTSSGIYANQFIQLGLYKVALKEWYGLDVKGIEIVQFPKDGKGFNHRRIIDPKTMKEFEKQGIRNVETHYFREKHDGN